MNRRQFVTGLAGGVAGALTGCAGRGTDPAPPGDSVTLHARPGTPTGSVAPGLHTLGFGLGRDGAYYVPAGYDGAQPMPLAILMHGAGRSSAEWWQSGQFATMADALGLVVLTPDSRGATWDLVLGAMGPDVRFLDAALGHLFSRCRVDPARILLGGFSDGASYALSLGAANGTLFRSLVGYSPGFFNPPRLQGRPRVFLSHGTDDTILPFDRTRSDIAPALRTLGYEVNFTEFSGGHTVPLAIARAGLEWGLAG